MRNIIDDLNERVAELEIEIAKAETKLEQLNDRKHSLKLLILEEESRWKAREQPSLLPELDQSLSLDIKKLRPLSQFLLSNLKDGGKTLDELKKAVIDSNIPIKASKPGRGIAVALMRLSKKGLAEKKADKWSLKNGKTNGMAGLNDLRASDRPTQPV